MSRPALLLKRHGLDLLIVLLAVLCGVSTALRDGTQRPTGLLLWLEVGAVTVPILALLARHRFPFAAPACLWLLSAALSFVDGRLIVTQPGLFIAGLGAALLLGNLRNGTQARTGLAIVVACAAIVVYHDPHHAAGEFLFVPVQFAIAWLVGFALRERAEETEAAEARARQAEKDRESAARVAVAEERARIARELHDVVAHSVSVMVLQVGAVRHRMPSTVTEDREALRNVEETGRTALAEMRRLLSAMRRENDQLELMPHPGLAGLGKLVDDVRATGLDVQVAVHGEPIALPPGLDLSAYRIVQEGLTNTLKHAHAGAAQVALDYGDTDLRLEVRDDGVGRPTTRADPGHGLVGIGERVKLFGGDMSAGAGADGGFVLRARLPLNGYAS